MNVHGKFKKIFIFAPRERARKMKNLTNKRVGVKDIAAKAGVSTGTVDRVLHNRGEVKEQTRERVMKIVKELGYTPNIYAKSLSSKKQIRIAIIIPDSSDNNPYWEKPISGIRRANDELKVLNAEIIFEHFNASDEKSFKSTLDDVLKMKLDGVILNPVFRSISINYLNKLDEKNIPYGFIDINLKDANNLAYFGQDAEQSGLVAARLIDLCTPENSIYLVVKLTNRKVFSRHIENRIIGFNRFFTNFSHKENISIKTVEIDLLDKNEPEATLDKVFEETNKIDGVFIPNSRGFIMGDYYDKRNIQGLLTVGFDLVDRNVNHLKSGNLTYLISQKPEEQSYKAIKALFNYVNANQIVRKKTNYSPIDIITKENIDYYYEN